MEWTGASPQRYKPVSGVRGERGVYFVEEAACFVEVVEVG